MKALRGVLLMLFNALTGAYGLSMTLFVIGRILIGEQWVLIAFFNSFTGVLWGMGLFLLPVALLLRQWLPAALVVPGVIAFIFSYGGQFIPRTVQVPEDAQNLSVLSYNILARDSDYQRTIEIIRTADADIVALQEISTRAAPLLEAGLRDVYPHYRLHPYRVGTVGQALFSRYPITDDDFWRYDSAVGLTLGQQRSVIDFAGTPITIYNVHPAHPGMTGSFFDPTTRNREIADILARMAQDDGLLLLVGDFNMPDLSDDHHQITARYVDAYQAAGWGMGWTFRYLRFLPAFLRLDYVFYSEGFQAHAARVITDAGGSDHFPLWVQLHRTAS